jgi:HAMP domain-containing protein
VTLGQRRWWLSGAILVAAAVMASAIASESVLAILLKVFAGFWVVASLWIMTWRLWRWMTYRVGMRLGFTYLLIGVLPLFFAAAFAAIGLYIMMGQYTSVRLGSELRRVRWELAHQCNLILHRAEIEGVDAAVSLFDEIAVTGHEPLPRVVWQARIGGRSVVTAGGEDLPEIEWIDGEERALTARHGDRAFGVVSAASPAGDRVTALIPLDEITARAISGAWWFDVAFLTQEPDGELESRSGDGDNVRISASGDGGLNFTLTGEEGSGSEIWPEWSEAEAGLLSRPLVVWFRVAAGVVDLANGEPLEEANLLALLRTSPRNVWRDFTLSRYELGAGLWGVIAALGIFFLICYGIAMATSATMILSITRSTSRLTAGARAVERGDLDHRVPVKRHDQLGDLARSFNHMTDAVQSMLADVAEKERLARELELAREIQESLLPASHLEVGPISVRATFKPATEVGGDYFDVFPISEDRIVVAIGDVAGHGLSTGLLMASLKSSVAALVHEGYGGTDLIAKVNHLLMEHGQARTMATLTIVEIDLGEGRLVLANAGHCPALLILPDGIAFRISTSGRGSGSGYGPLGFRSDDDHSRRSGGTRRRDPRGRRSDNPHRGTRRINLARE